MKSSRIVVLVILFAVLLFPVAYVTLAEAQDDFRKKKPTVGAQDEYITATVTHQGRTKAPGQLASKIQDQLTKLAKRGYEVVSVFPVIGGSIEHKNIPGTTGYGGGYSYTTGAVIVAKKRQLNTE